MPDQLRTTLHRLAAALRERMKALRESDGFTLIEVMIVMMILGILVEMAVPAYISITFKAERAQAASSLRNVVPWVVDYYADNGTYAGMTAAKLNAAYDISLDGTQYGFGTGTLDTYCITYTTSNGDYTAQKAGPDATIAVLAGSAPCS